MLDEYDGNLSDLLRGILQECGCETRIPVKKYAYYEGRVFQKYRVGIMLPAKLGMSMIMPAGEACIVSVAYKIAIVKVKMKEYMKSTGRLSEYKATSIRITTGANGRQRLVVGYREKAQHHELQDSKKLRYATHLLCGPAAAWWDNIVAIRPLGRVFTW
jgi:hypothetical protein